MRKDKLQNILCVILPMVFLGVLVGGIFKVKEDNKALTKLKEKYELATGSQGNNEGTSKDTAAKEEIKDGGNKGNISEDTLKKFNFEEKSILFLGDGVSVDGKYQGIAAEQLKLKNYINGARSGLLLGDMDDELTEETLKDIDIVVIFGGTNDYSTGNVLGTVEDNKDIASFYGNVQSVIDNVKALNNAIEIVFLTPLKHGYLEGQPSYPNANYNGNYLNDYVKAIIEICDKNKVKYIDMFEKSGIDENNVVQYTYNNIILNEEGHNLVGTVLARELKELFKNNLN